MDAAAAHPTEPILKAYALGRMAGASASSIESHLGSCTRCRNRVSEISSDGFLGELRHAPRSARFGATGRSVIRRNVDHQG